MPTASMLLCWTRDALMPNATQKKAPNSRTALRNRLAHVTAVVDAATFSLSTVKLLARQYMQQQWRQEKDFYAHRTLVGKMPRPMVNRLSG